MNAFLDTSVVVRYLLDDPPEMAEQAGRIIDSGARLQITDVALAETAYILTRVYRLHRAAVVDHLITFVQKRNMTVFSLDKGAVIDGLLLCRPSGRVSFADALIWSAARCSGAQTVYSFDRRFPAGGVEVRDHPGAGA